MKNFSFLTAFAVVIFAFALCSCNGFKSTQSAIGKGCTKFTAPGPKDNPEAVFYGVKDGNGHIFIGPENVTEVSYENGVYTYVKAGQAYLAMESKPSKHYQIAPESTENYQVLLQKEEKLMSLCAAGKMVIDGVKNLWVHNGMIFVQDPQGLWGLKSISGAELLPCQYKVIIAAFQTKTSVMSYLVSDGKTYIKLDSSGKTTGTIAQALVTKLLLQTSKAGTLKAPAIDNSPVSYLEVDKLPK